ncbi:MAG: fumarylacetoacetate hydrolase family protein [Sphingomonas sp.]|jgi:fumarylacetoacetate (FAA) hydrolase|uniref:fumarylacetoacetate hydrolase family protein n=1 Tax=Sphingomonas sp. TaxID=28214 RepID=UPI0035637003
MKLATLDTGGDGTLLIVSRDLTRAARAEGAPTLQAALDDWETIEPVLRHQADAVEASTTDTMAVDPMALAAVLPRSYQFLDASAFLAHNHILARAWGFEPRGGAEPPLMYQGLSDRFYAPHAPVPFRGFDDDVDFEAEFGVITDAVPLGVTPCEALRHARLILMLNDWSLRAFGPKEMQGGFGFLHAKPPTTLSAFAATPDELGDAWSDGRVKLPLLIERNSQRFGEPDGSAMHFGFGDLIAHAAATRDLCAGTVIGSGTVSNYNAADVGSGCIAERRALDTLANRELTPYLAEGERIGVELRDAQGRAIIGKIDQRIVCRT